MENETAAASAKGATAKNDWDFKDIDFKRRRTQVAFDAAVDKGRRASTPNGALNYSEQVGRYRQRFDRDLKDALARFSAAANGLKLLYNYPEPIPPTVMTCIQDGNMSDAVQVFEALLEWVRDAIAYLVAFGEFEQSVTQTLSLKQLIGNEAWVSGTKTGTWNFSVPESLFSGLTNVRLRGLNVYLLRGLDGHLAKGFWSGTITVPLQSTIHFHGGGSETLDQSSFPQLRLGRIGSRGDFPYRETYGVTSLRNASPIGMWQLTLAEKSTEGDGRWQLSDIYFDFDVMVRQ
jgi:hypothetical protein